MKKCLFKKICILGLGLIGGSLGMALNRRRYDGIITGWDVEPGLCRKALEREAINVYSQSLEEAVSGSDLIVLAVPVHMIPEAMKEAVQYFSPGALVTDVASTKERTGNIIRFWLPPGCSYIGGHPMAGSERNGLEGADPYLFENAVYLLMKNAGPDSFNIKLLKELVILLGAEPLVITEQEHDHMIGMVSHLPHLAAAALVKTAAADPAGSFLLSLAAGGFKSTTRIAASNPKLWQGIIESNKEQVLASLASFKLHLDTLAGIIEKNDSEGLAVFLMEAGSIRKNLPVQTGTAKQNYQVMVLAPDKPGIIGRIADVLGREEINIASIEVLRVREDEEGSISLEFRHAWERDRASELISALGMSVWPR